MKIITQLVILTLSLLLVNADQYCDNFLKQYNTFRNNCSLQSLTINNCCDLRIVSSVSGVYKLNSADVYCDMNTTTGGWMVIQRNKKDSLVNFNRNWNDYEKGFGDLNTEFWYGLESMHHLTQSGQWEMRVDYQKNDNTWSYLHYNQFSVGSASAEYPLTVGEYSGSILSFNALYFNGMKFSTPDNDNDEYSDGNCAAYYNVGYWYKYCRYVNLNNQPPSVYPPGNIMFGEMKIRPKDCITQ